MNGTCYNLRAASSATGSGENSGALYCSDLESLSPSRVGVGSPRNRSSAAAKPLSVDEACRIACFTGSSSRVGGGGGDSLAIPIPLVGDLDPLSRPSFLRYLQQVDAAGLGGAAAAGADEGSVSASTAASSLGSASSGSSGNSDDRGSVGQRSAVLDYADTALAGRVSTIYFFSEALTEHQLAGLHALGPQYCHMLERREYDDLYGAGSNHHDFGLGRGHDVSVPAGASVDGEAEGHLKGLFQCRARVLDGAAGAALMLVLSPSVSKPMASGHGHCVVDITPSSAKTRWTDAAVCSMGSAAGPLLGTVGRKSSLLVASVSGEWRQAQGLTPEAHTTHTTM